MLLRAPELQDKLQDLLDLIAIPARESRHEHKMMDGGAATRRRIATRLSSAILARARSAPPPAQKPVPKVANRVPTRVFRFQVRPLIAQLVQKRVNIRHVKQIDERVSVHLPSWTRKGRQLNATQTINESAVAFLTITVDDDYDRGAAAD